MHKEKLSIHKMLAFVDGQEGFDSTHPISPEVEKSILSKLKKVEFPKGSVLNVPGKPADKIYFIQSGLMVTTYLMDGKEIGTGFFADGDIGGDNISFLTNQSSKLTVKLVEPSVLYVLSREDLDSLNEKFPEMEDFRIRLYNHVVHSQQLRIEDMLSGSSAERYNKFLSRFPDIIYRLPLGFIASFLGMSQENLSRIRSQKN